jgi:hypothetical protein
MLAAHFCHTDCRYAFFSSNLSAFSKAELRFTISFEVPPVLFKLLGGPLVHCRLGFSLTLDNFKKVDKTIMTDQ